MVRNRNGSQKPNLNKINELKMDSATELMHEKKVYKRRDFFAYKFLKLTGKIIREKSTYPKRFFLRTKI